MAIALHTADQFLGFIITIGAMQVCKRGFMTDPSLIFGLRIAFAVAILLQISAMLYIKRMIAAKNDKTVFKHRNEPSLFNLGDNEEVETTHADYDMKELNKGLRSVLIHSLAIAVIHYKWQATQPLIIHTMGFLRSLLFSPLYRAHIYQMVIYRPFDQNMLWGTATSVVPRVPTEVDQAPAEKKKKKED